MKKSLKKSVNQNIYVIRKYVKASSAAEAIKKEKDITVHDCWLEEQTQKEIINRLYEEKEKIGF